uniref:Sulfotransferase domain-containing protein n=1 Tax=Lotharella oceanica TaxID=641309 RepID=A0A7S2X9X4_9EUKA
MPEGEDGGVAETHYFDRSLTSKKRPFPSDEKYCSYFDAQRNGKVAVVGEKTPVYMHLPSAMNRIARALPSVKIIVVLRNPVERAWSHWKYWKRDPRNFLDILGELKGSSKRSRQDVLRRGFYDEHLERIYSLFDKARVHVMIAERVWSDPVTHYNKLFEFLGVAKLAENPNIVGRRPQVRNRSSGGGKLAPEARAAVQEAYAPHNERLYDVLGYRVLEWEKNNGSTCRDKETHNKAVQNAQKKKQEGGEAEGKAQASVSIPPPSQNS